MCGQHSAVLPTPIQKTALFACFRFLNFSSIFPGGQLTPFAPMCGRPCLGVHLVSSKGIKFNIDPFKCAFYVACNSIFTYSNGVDQMALLILQETSGVVAPERTGTPFR